MVHVSGVRDCATCRTDGQCAFARQQVNLAKMWNRLVLERREPLLLTHNTLRLPPGSYAAITGFKRVSKESVLASVRSALLVYMKDWPTRPAFSVGRDAVVSGMLQETIPMLVEKMMEPLKLPDIEGQEHYAVPHGNVWDGVSTRLHEEVSFNPVVAIMLEENPADAARPLPTSAHVSFPLKPSVVQASSELLSCSFGPGQHRLLMHAPGADTLFDEESVASHTILMSRVSAMADFARTRATTLNSEVLRHGRTMHTLRQKVASKGGRWALRHVRLARDGAAAPLPTHPSGNIDGRNDAVPNDDV